MMMNRGLAFLAIFIFSSAMFAQTLAHQEPVAAQALAAMPDLSGIWSRLRDGAVARGYENVRARFPGNRIHP